MAHKRRKRLIGIDFRGNVLEQPERKSSIRWSKHLPLHIFDLRAYDVIVAVDAFELFADPAGILRIMSTLVRRPKSGSSDARASLRPLTLWDSRTLVAQLGRPAASSSSARPSESESP
jgi:hypothetical protein